jgi:hypothetical protein
MRRNRALVPGYLSRCVHEPKIARELSQIEKAVVRTGLGGTWRALKYGQKQYHTDDGGVLNWRETTGTISFQGVKTAAKEELATAFTASAKERLVGVYRGQVFCLGLRSLYPEPDLR